MLMLVHELLVVQLGLILPRVENWMEIYFDYAYACYVYLCCVFYPFSSCTSSSSSYLCDVSFLKIASYCNSSVMNQLMIHCCCNCVHVYYLFYVVLMSDLEVCVCIDYPHF